MDMERIMSQMTLEDKIAFCTGADMWRTKKMDQYGIEQIMMSDGPHGLRCQKGDSDMLGIHESIPAACFPTAVTAGATWNRELYAAEGEAIGKETMAASFIQGQQSTGALSSVKHFAVNSQEYKRQNGDSQLDERTLRVIHLQKVFCRWQMVII